MQYTLKEHFQFLQWKQDRHDALYHADIYTLTRKNNLTHMTMHLSKYLGGMISQYVDVNHQNIELDKLSADFVIVLMSMANRVNINLAAEIENEVDSYTSTFQGACADYSVPEVALEAVTNYFSQSHLRIVDDTKFYLDVAVRIGNLAKAIEALDHLEQYPSREFIEKSVHDLFRLIMRFRASYSFKNLGSYIWQRMAKIESKNVLYELMPKYTEDYRELNNVSQ